MWDETLERRWQGLADEVFIGIREWRQQHPKATFAEIEQAIDERLTGVRARMLQDVALSSAAARHPATRRRHNDKPVAPFVKRWHDGNSRFGSRRMLWRSAMTHDG